MRWVAALGWAAAAVYLFSRTGSDPALPAANWITAAVCSTVALTIAAGGRSAQVGASIGAFLAGLVTILGIGLCVGVGFLSPWLGCSGLGSPLPVALALTVISFLAEREVQRLKSRA